MPPRTTAPRDPCSDCKGSGSIICPTCNGQVLSPDDVCCACGGNGELQCFRCGGTGREPAPDGKHTSHKVVLTNRGALTAKYAPAGLKQILDALRALKAADSKRGIRTSVIAVDDPRAMAPFQAPPVNDHTDARQTKVAVDAVFAALTPEYLVLLGSTDVIPLVPIHNPVYGLADRDRFAWGDLPYACEAPFSQDIADFKGPTRVVGRIPDITSTRDPSYLVGLLRIAARWTSRKPAGDKAFFGLSAAVWEESSKLSLKALFGPRAVPRVSPPKGPSWTKVELAPPTHFINCHGAPIDPNFYGEDTTTSDFPVAHTATRLAGRVSSGTVAAAEACYGAELYDPEPIGGQMGIANTYLAEGAYGYLGSSTIAYGEVSTASDADVICREFLRHVLSGASLGRAMLEARQDFVRLSTANNTPLDPMNLKTLAQFYLLGDPSIHPVVLPKPKAALPSGEHAQRVQRRHRLSKDGHELDARTSVCSRATGRLSSVIQKELETHARDIRLTSQATLSFAVPSRPISKRKGILAPKTAPEQFHVLIGHAPHTTVWKAWPGEYRPIVAVVVHERDGRTISTRQLQSR